MIPPIDQRPIVWLGGQIKKRSPVLFFLAYFVTDRITKEVIAPETPFGGVLITFSVALLFICLVIPFYCWGVKHFAKEYVLMTDNEKRMKKNRLDCDGSGWPVVLSGDGNSVADNSPVLGQFHPETVLGGYLEQPNLRTRNLIK